LNRLLIIRKSHLSLMKNCRSEIISWNSMYVLCVTCAIQYSLDTNVFACNTYQQNYPKNNVKLSCIKTKFLCKNFPSFTSSYFRST
jgi:hypothetical protein